MVTKAFFISDIDLLGCPFMEKCKLPKIDFLCRIPECKTCPDYISNVEELKLRFLF